MVIDLKIASFVISLVCVLLTISGTLLTILFASVAQIFAYGKLTEKIKHLEIGQAHLSDCQKDCSRKYAKVESVEKFQHKLCTHLNKIDDRMIEMDKKRQEAVVKNTTELNVIRVAIGRIEEHLNK